MQIVRYMTFNYLLASLMVVALAGCNASDKASTSPTGISPQTMADAIHTVLESDRTAYARFVVTRLVNQDKVIKASEHWKDEKALPLPAQMFRLSGEIAQEKNTGVTFTLLSQWPINKKNAPRTDAEKAGLKHISEHLGENYYAEEMLGNQRYFTAVYPDIAVAEACVTCHNEHVDSPRDNYKLGEVMGGVVIRFLM